MKKAIIRRSTKQKSIILEELSRVRTHPSADEIFKMVRKRLPLISFGTVYRNLNLLKEQGRILELACGKYSCRYDATTANHYHFVCLSCSGVFDVDEPLLKNIDKRVTRESGMEVKYHRIKFFGYCHECKNKDS